MRRLFYVSDHLSVPAFMLLVESGQQMIAEFMSDSSVEGQELGRLFEAVHSHDQ